MPLSVLESPETNVVALTAISGAEEDLPLLSPIFEALPSLLVLQLLESQESQQRILEHPDMQFIMEGVPLQLYP